MSNFLECTESIFYITFYRDAEMVLYSLTHSELPRLPAKKMLKYYFNFSSLCLSILTSPWVSSLLIMVRAPIFKLPSLTSFRMAVSFLELSMPKFKSNLSFNFSLRAFLKFSSYSASFISSMMAADRMSIILLGGEANFLPVRSLASASCSLAMMISLSPLAVA